MNEIKEQKNISADNTLCNALLENQNQWSAIKTQQSIKLIEKQKNNIIL
jgi:hypothetical protein